ncbi:MAG: NADH-quinone oxidoreductase subunit C [Nitrospirota bacterium]
MREVEPMAVTEVRVSVYPAGLAPQAIAEKIKEKFPEQVIDIAEFRDQVSVIVKRDQIFQILRYLHDDPLLSLDHLQDLTAVDYQKKKEIRFEVVYNLYSIRYRHHIRIRAQVPENDTKIASVVPIWAGADWHERECFDMFGIEFSGHPDLRRILMPEDWEGYPLRKDYPLQGPALENDWPEFIQVLKRSKELREFEWEG